ncbi:hypothetical protein OF83DRAFT_1111985 [Amylostereum chailletii]|nr:hypothetical protein OF83DRAFT_1111985 [Amylostereum chailletii]
MPRFPHIFFLRLPIMLTKNDYSNDPNLDTIILMGTIFAGIGYGVVCALYGITVCHDRRNWKMWCMRTWLAILATIAFALQIRWTVVAFVLERNYAGGPHVFVEQNDGDWINVMLNATYVVLSWSADLVMLYRCCIIYSGRLRTYVVFPVIMFIANLVGSLFLRQLAEPGTHAYAGDRIDYLVAYRTVSLALSAIATGLIVGRILHHRHEMRAFSKSTSDKRFTSVVTMFVESAALETVTALLYIILVGIESPGQSIVLPILGQVQVRFTRHGKPFGFNTLLGHSSPRYILSCQPGSSMVEGHDVLDLAAHVRPTTHQI